MAMRVSAPKDGSMLMSPGLKPSEINMVPFSGTDIYTAMGKRGTELDMGTSMGWCSDYSDPYDWLNVLLYGGGHQAGNNNNYMLFNGPKWKKEAGSAGPLWGSQCPPRFWQV